MEIKNSAFRIFYLPVLLATIVVLMSPELISAQTAEAQSNERDLKTRPAQVVAAWPSSAKRFALVIGVDDYQDAQINKLEGASNDARSLADALSQYAGFPKDQVILLTSDQSIERRPTMGNILRKLSNLRAIAPQDGLLLVAFAGHGIERDNQAYLLPSDAQLSEDLGLLQRTAINVNDIQSWIRKTGVGQIMLILDACRNDPLAGRSNGDNILTEAFIRGFNFEEQNRNITAFVTLYATGVGHRAYEYKEKKQGYFTWMLVEALKGGAADEDGLVTLASLVKYIQEQVPKQILMDLGKGKDQRPFVEIGGYKADELVIAVVQRPVPISAKETPSLQPVDSKRIELTFWETIKNSTDPGDYKDYLDKFPNGEFIAIARRRVQSLSSQPALKPESNNKDSAPPPSISPVSSNDQKSLFKPGRPIRTATIDIIGKRDWTSTGLIVKRGDRLRVSATGTVTLDPASGRTSGPEGTTDLPDPKKLMPDQPTGALIGVIGADNDEFILIGRSSEFTATRDGLLFLSVNEGELSDNAGTYKAVIEVQAQKQ